MPGKSTLKPEMDQGRESGGTGRQQIMNEARALLDELMGVSRDGERQELRREFSDPEVCKFYIQGFCFMEEFQRTKHHYGDCSKVHDDHCRQQWDALSDDDKQKYPYERELHDWLDKMMGDLRSKIRRNEERIKQISDPPLMSQDQTKLAEMEQDVKRLKRKSNELGETGDIDAAHTATTQAEALESEAKNFQSEAKQRALDNLNRYGEQEVCQFSGVIINSEESRLRDHKSGKNYRAWVHAHTKKKQLDETFQRRKQSSESLSALDRVSNKAKDSYQGRNRDSTKDRERPRERGRETGRPLDRYSESREYRSREDRSIERDRHRHRSRSRTQRHREIGVHIRERDSDRGLRFR